jgi:hypothetical protein
VEVKGSTVRVDDAELKIKEVSPRMRHPRLACGARTARSRKPSRLTAYQEIFFCKPCSLIDPPQPVGPTQIITSHIYTTRLVL